MRKASAILLMIVLLFYAGGYRFAIQLLEKKVSQQLETKIDQLHYDESELIEIAVDLNMPYQERFTDFERHYGQINIDGKSYTYVMRKVDGQRVIFKCIANSSKDALRTVQDNLTKANSHNSSNTPSHHPASSLVKIFMSDYEEQTSSQSFALIESSSIKRQIEKGLQLTSSYILTPHQPPEA